MLAFWDVDTEKDFMLKIGKSYVLHAEDIIPILKRLTRFAYCKVILILGSVDRHFADDVEVKIRGEHCMDKTEGQEKIAETLLPKHLVTYIRSKVGSFGKYEDYSVDEVHIEVKNHRQILFEKQHTDVFTNRNVMKFLGKLRVFKVVVYGVATEYCVKDAVLGLLKLGITVYVVEDAIKPIDQKEGEKAILEMKEKGAYFLESKDIIRFIEGGMEWIKR